MRPDEDKPVIGSEEAAIDEPPLRDESLAGLLFSAAVLVVASVFFVQSIGIDSDAEIWPRTLSAILVVLSLIHLLRSVLARVRSGGATDDSLARQRMKRRLFAAGWLFALCIAAPWIGFGPAALLFVPVYLLAAGVRSPLLIVAVTAFAAIGITLLFGLVAGVPIWKADL